MDGAGPAVFDAPAGELVGAGLAGTPIHRHGSTSIYRQPMIRLRFTGVTHPYGVFVGPAPWFRIAGGAIYRGPGGETVARMHDQRWQVRGSIFNRFDCRQPLTIEMEGAAGEIGESAGQFDECAVVGGTIFGEGAP